MIDLSKPFLAKVKKVSVVNKDSKKGLVVTFVYYATKLLNDGEVVDEEVKVMEGHPLYSRLSNLRSGDELRAIPLTNEIVRIIPKNRLFSQIMKG